MQKFVEQKFIGERAMFGVKDAEFERCGFAAGESPLKHGQNLRLKNCIFEWKYPLWYAKNIAVEDGFLTQTARAGIWYAQDVSFKDTLIQAPKSFRRCQNLRLENVNLTQAEETLWSCADAEIKNVCAHGDYFAMNCENVRVYGLNLDGNYGFDGCKNLLVEDSKLLSKDAFWNCENVTVRNSFISGEYLAWNSKNVTFENCTIESLQGLCYVQNLMLRGCRTLDTTLAFEYSSVDVEILGGITSVKNPLSGVIRAMEIGEVIIEKECVDPAATKIIYLK